MPAVGGRLRHGQKFSLQANPPSQLKYQLQWATMDRMIWLVLNGTQEDLAPLVEDPEAFMAQRDQTLFAQTDATAVWIKLRGEESRVIPEDVLDGLAQVRCKKHNFQQAAGCTKEEHQLLEQALQQAVDEAEDYKEQVDQQWSQGGDKYRLTFLITGVTSNWFSRDKTPQGHLQKIKILYRCAHPVRLEDITAQGTWARSHQYVDSFGKTVTRKAGESAQGLLGWWVRFRTSHPDHDFWKHYQVWGQPSAWQDQVITTWLIEDLAKTCQEQFGVSQAIHQWDCLGS